MNPFEPGVDDRGRELTRWAETTPTSWKNGAGITRELASSPGRDPFDWRISIAEVATSAEFSTFADVERTIVLLEGAAMSLTVAGVTHELTGLAPWMFDGSLATSCAVAQGPTRDLNVMTRRGRCQATVEIIDVDGSVTLPLAEGATQFLIPLRGQISVERGAVPALVLDRYDLLRLGDARRLTVRGVGPIAHIEIH
jgi:environmental stress-induced protein Ves